MTVSKIEKWIKTGYKLLGTEGIDGIKIEQLAKILNLNKSGFYYYFGTLGSYLESLLQYHIRQSHDVAAEIRNCNTIDPDLLLVIVKYKAFFLVETQLLVKSKPSHINRDVDEAGKIISRALLSLWEKTAEMPSDTSISLAYMNIIRHFFYASIDVQNINYESLHTLTFETRGVLEKVIGERHFSSQTEGSAPKH